MTLSKEQTELAMVVGAKISGVLSIVGSSFIIRDVAKRWRKKRSNEHLPTTTWLVLSMSIADLGSSFFAHFLGSWMSPKEEDFPLAVGTDATCRAQAYLFMISFSAGGGTSGMLALTYWLTICRDKSENELRARKWKALLYGTPWLYAFAIAAAATYLVTPAQVPMTVYCWATFGELGSLADTIGGIIAVVCYIIMTALVFLSMVALIRFVYQNETRMQRYAFRAGAGVSRTNTIQVTKQGILYILVWLVIIIPMTIDTVALLLISDGDYSKLTLPNWYHVLYSSVMPLQGFLNAVVYFRPKYAKLRKRGLSRLSASAEVLGLSSRGVVTTSNDKGPENEQEEVVGGLPPPEGSNRGNDELGQDMAARETAETL